MGWLLLDGSLEGTADDSIGEARPGVRSAGRQCTYLTQESAMTVTGGCLCGAVRWESEEPPITTRTCWCRDCQYLGAGSGTVGACFRAATFKVSGTTSDF